MDTYKVKKTRQLTQGKNILFLNDPDAGYILVGLPKFW